MDQTDEAVAAVLRRLSRRGRLSLTAGQLAEMLRWRRPARSLGAALKRGALLERFPLEATMIFAAVAEPSLSPAAAWAKGLEAERRVLGDAARARANERREARRRRGEVAAAGALLARARRASPPR